MAVKWLHLWYNEQYLHVEFHFYAYFLISYQTIVL